MPNRTPSPAEPADALGYLVKHAHQRLTALTDAALASFDIDSRDFGILRVLADRPPMSQHEVATLLRLDRTTMVARIDGLESRGFVTRSPDPVDRRRNAIELTKKGHEVCRRGDSAYRAAEEEFLAPLSKTAAAEFRRALRTLLVID